VLSDSEALARLSGTLDVLRIGVKPGSDMLKDGVAPASCVFHVDGSSGGSPFVIDYWMSNAERAEFCETRITLASGRRVSPRCRASKAPTVQLTARRHGGRQGLRARGAALRRRPLPAAAADLVALRVIRPTRGASVSGALAPFDAMEGFGRMTQPSRPSLAMARRGGREPEPAELRGDLAHQDDVDLAAAALRVRRFPSRPT
jgi:hypothetical protein